MVEEVEVKKTVEVKRSKRRADGVKKKKRGGEEV